MSHRALASFLDDFSGARGLRGGRAEHRPDALDLVRLKARTEALEEARLDQEKLLQELAARHESEMRLARERWVAEEAGRLEEALARVSSDVTARVCVLVSECLRPFLENSAREAALDSFAEHLRELLAPGGAMRLRISGASDHLAAIRARLGEAASSCDFVESAHAGLEASLAGSVVTSRLDEWLGAFASSES